MKNKFPSSWEMMRLEDCMAAIIDYRGKTPTKVNFGIPLITAKIIKDGRIGAVEEYIAGEDYDIWMSRGFPKSGDIVMTTEGPLGEIAQLNGTKVALGQRVITLRGHPNLLDNTFLKFQMMSSYIQDQLFARSTGTTVQGIRQSELRKINLIIPSLAEQQGIASILGALNDKIEQNRQMNETLEGIARALFKSWFVDFDPVRAKVEGRQPYGIDAEVAELFPVEFEDSTLGKIPKGWKVKGLPEILEVNPTRFLRNGQVAPYLEMSNMPNTSARALSWEDRAFSSGVKFINGDTLVARITPCLENGKTAFVDFLTDEEVGWGSTEYIILRSRSPLPMEYSYFLARSENFRAYAIRNMVGTSGRQRVPSGCFNSYLTIEPPQKCAKIFGDVAQSMIKAMKQKDEETKTLSILRDTLLPKLLSGAIRVKDAEKAVESVL